MDLQIRTIHKKSEQLSEIKKLYLEAFPKDEQIPFSFLLSRAKEPHIEFIGFYDNTDLVGLTYLVTHEYQTFVLYFAINSKIRSKGYGSRCLNLIKSMFPNNTIVLNIEAMDENAKNYDQRLKREQFYLRNGYQYLDFRLGEGPNTFEVLALNGTVTEDEFHHLLTLLAGPYFSWIVKYFIKLTDKEFKI